MNVLITGASGFLGSAVLSRIGLNPAYQGIYLLLRTAGKKTAQMRLEEIVKKIFRPEDHTAVMAKVRVFSGDLTLPHLGLSAKDRWEILKGVNQILHVGASTDFGAPLDESRRHNVEGTRKVLELAEACVRQGALERLDYISTCFVSGDKAGEVLETDLERGQTFANNYEQSKFEAECLVRDYRHTVPVVIHRPSIVVGDSRSGYTPHFKVLYWPLRILSKNLLPFVPANRRARLDVVPVDFVADAIVALMQDRGALGRTYHLSAGIGEEVRVGRILRDAVQHAGVTARPLIPFWVFRVIMNSPLRGLFREELWQTVELARPYTRYLEGTGVRFNAAASHARLKELGISAPSWDDYKVNVMRYCTESRWGRKLALPEFSYYERAKA